MLSLAAILIKIRPDLKLDKIPLKKLSKMLNDYILLNKKNKESK